MDEYHNRKRVKLSSLAKPLTATAVAACLALGGTPLIAQAAGETLNINLQVTKSGTAPFDGDDAAGNDSSETNKIIRTNDIIEYQIDVVSNGGTAENPVVSLTLPKGQEFRDVPAWCRAAAGSTDVATPTPAIGEPATPITADTWKSLPKQTLTCHIPNLANSATQFLTVPVWQRSEVPNGTKLETAVASIKSDAVTTPVTSQQDVSLTVSSAPKWDLRKNGIGTQENSGYSYGNFKACSWDESRNCHIRSYSILIGGKEGGKGLAPFTGDVTFTEDLSPASFYGSEIVNGSAWQAAGDKANEKYAPRLVSCETRKLFHMSPGNGTGDLTESVRNSGTVTCNHPAPGEPATVTISGADWSLYTYPKKVATPANKPAIADGTAYAVSAVANVEIPVDAIADLGIKIRNTTSLNIRNEYKNLQGQGLDGTANPAGSDPLENNYLASTPLISLPGGFTKFFGGVGGAEGNVPANQFMSGDAFIDGPPGSTIRRSGTNQAGPGQTVTSVLHLVGSGLSNSAPGQALLCDAWDNSKLQLHAGDWGTGTAEGQEYGSKGKAVWLSGISQAAKDATYSVQYSADSSQSGQGAGSTCQDGTWFDDPAQVPGNDPELAKQGIYTAVNHVRIYTTIEEPARNAQSLVYQFYSIALRVVPDQAEGTILPNWASAVYKYGADKPTLEELVALNTTGSAYNPDNHSGEIGDRLIYSPAYVRVSKDVSVNGAEFKNRATATAGDKLVWKLTPTLSSAATSKDVLKQPVYLEECLPEGVIYDSASLTPTVGHAAPAPAGAEITCQKGTYLKFYLGDFRPNEQITPVEINAHVSTVARPETYTNTVVVQTTPNDPSPLAQRSATAQVTVSQIAGLKLEKQALTPVVQVNPEGNATKQKNEWQIDFVNLDSPQAISNIDVIDVLPSATGVNESKFSGTMKFDSVEQLQGDKTQLLYTSAKQVDTNPDAASNGTGGIAWCDKPAGGSVVKGSGACPAAAAEVTALRFVRPGPFVSNDHISAKIVMVAEGNKHGDSYINAVEGSAEGLVFNVGPVTAREVAVSGSVGDYVWIDADLNGVQDENEKPLANFPVKLAGTDDLGNAVALETVTGKNGKYEFTGLRSGNYTVTFDPAGLQGGMTFTQQQAGSDRAVDSDGDQTTGVTAEFALAAAQQRTDIDQGVVLKPARLGDYVWVDKNANGVQDEGEDPVAGFKVKLSGTDILGEPVERETTTDNAGKYLFDNLVPGTYVVTFDPASLPAGHEFVAAGAGDDRAKDSDGDQKTGATATIKLGAGERNLTVDQGIKIKYAKLGDYVWIDANANGTQDEGEKPVADFKVKLTGTDVYGNKVEKETTTNAEGKYLFDKLVPGDYVVTFDPASLPAGHEFVAAGAGDDRAKDSDGDQKTGATATIKLGAGERNLTVDQGIKIKYAKLGDYVWIDANANGTQDEGEKPVADFKVKLTGTDVYGNKVEKETMTNDEGKYLFDGLVPGKYVVTFDPAGLPAGHRFVAQSAGEDRAKDSDGNAETGVTAEITLGAGEENLDIDQGIEAIPAEPGVPVVPADPPKPKLVVTGGAAPTLLIGSGALALLIAAGFFLVSRKRRSS